MIKIFKKRGPLHYTEKRMVKQLEEHFKAELEKNPDFLKDFQTMTSRDELRAMHTRYCASDAEIISETKHSDTQTTETMAKKKGEEEHILSNEKEINLNGTKSDLSNENISFDNPSEEAFDPMNKENPIVREYVLKKDAMNPDDKTMERGPESFKEPTTAEEAFTLPVDEEKDFTSGGGSGASDKKPKKDKTDTVNPDFSEMRGGAKNKKTKRMAKYIIRGFCTLLEHGVPILATKDITPVALAKQAKAKQIDLSVILQLDNETQVSIMEYFTFMRTQAKELGKIPEELKEDLIDDLYEFLIEKGVTPTPTQSLMMGLLEITFIVGLKTLEFRQQISQAKDIATPVKAKAKTKEAEALMQKVSENKNETVYEETAKPAVEEEEEEGGEEITELKEEESNQLQVTS